MKQYHHDGHGLNDSFVILHDERDPDAGGASHHYSVMSMDMEKDGDSYISQHLDVQYQHGGRAVEGSTKGIVDEVLYAIIIDRLECFLAGPFGGGPDGANARELKLVKECLAIRRGRADERAARGVLGKNEG